MTYNTFIQVCNGYNILPDIALENETIEKALRDGATTETLKTLLETEF